MITEALKPAIQWLHLHPNFAGIFAYLVAFTESVAVIGTIIPGSIMMTAVGGLIGAKVIPIGPTLILGIAGAITGDSLSYFLGYHYRSSIRSMWPFYRFENLMVKGETFFENHGRKSIFLGRFVGPIRSFVPLIAGMLNCQPRRFFPVNICSASIWAPAYMLPGILLGAASHALPSKLALQLFVYLISFLLLIWLSFWLYKCIARPLKRLTSNLIEQTDHVIQNHYITHFFCKLLFGYSKSNAKTQIRNFFFMGLSLLLLLIVMLDVSLHGLLPHLDISVFHFLQSIRTPSFDLLFSAITLFGQKRILIFPFAILLGWSLWSGHKRLAWYWLLLGFFVIGNIFAIKHMMHIVRPEGLSFPRISYSFPSGHATLSSAFYGFLALLIGKSIKPNMRTLFYRFAGIFIVLICFSRIYLGAHWLSDIISGILLGAFWVFMINLFYMAQPHKKLVINSFLSVILLSLILPLYIYSAFYFKYHHYGYQPAWPHFNINTNHWWSQKTIDKCLYAKSRSGKPMESMNIQWGDKLSNIETSLKTNGWQLFSKPTFRSLLKSKGSKTQPMLPWLLPLYHDQAPVRIFYKKEKRRNHYLVIQFWKTHVTLSNHLPLWLATLSRFHSRKHSFDLEPTHDDLSKQDPILRSLFSKLSDHQWKKIKIKHLSKNNKTYFESRYLILIKGE